MREASHTATARSRHRLGSKLSVLFFLFIKVLLSA